MKLEDIKKFIDENKGNEDVSAYLNDLRKEGLADFIESDEGYKLVKPVFDRKVSKALDTYKKESVPSLVEKELEKLKPNLEREFKAKFKVSDPDDPIVAELRNKIHTIEKDLENERSQKGRVEKLALIKGKLATAGLDEFADMFIADTLEATVERTDGVLAKLDTIVNKKVEERLKGGAYKPPTGQGGGGSPSKITKAELKAMTPEKFKEVQEGLLNKTITLVED